jgi:isoprenylcysteine carboxyl methyltransferase (ICMT) family protein YpbQ
VLAALRLVQKHQQEMMVLTLCLALSLQRVVAVVVAIQQHQHQDETAAQAAVVAGAHNQAGLATLHLFLRHKVIMVGLLLVGTQAVAAEGLALLALHLDLLT